MIDGGWSGVSPAATGLLADPIGASVNNLILDMKRAASGQSYLEWVRLRDAAELHNQLVAPHQASDTRSVDALSRCATRIALVNSMPQSTAERLLDAAVALRDRLPRVAECLRDGLVTASQVRTIVERTDLVTEPDHQKSVDTDVADALRRGGSWSAHRMRDMIDRVVFRVDPAAVRARRRAALDARSFWLERGEDGMGIISTSMTAEHSLALFRRVETVAGHVCAHDPRTPGARRSDAHFCLVMAVPWECLCGNGSCDADSVPDPVGPANRDVATAASRTVVHVICDLETAAGDGEHPGFIDGYGVVTADHIRDIINEPATRVQPIGFDDKPLRPTHPKDPYRPSVALDTIVRARSLYCDMPGCSRPVWRCDLDHIDEYDHHSPDRGGQTTPAGLGPKCRFHHNLKTFTDFLDVRTIDSGGRTGISVVTPEGLIVPGPAFTGDDLFPALRDITFDKFTHAPPDTAEVNDIPPTRRHTRLEDKHARRRRAREVNQKAIDDAASGAKTTSEALTDPASPPDAFPRAGFDDEPPF